MKSLFPARTRVLVGILVGGLVTGVHLWGGLDRLEDLSVDYRLRLRPARPAPDEVRLVGINDQDVASKLGPWPFSRAVHSDALRILQALEVRHATLDVLFTEPSPVADRDAKLKEAVEQFPSITLGYHFGEAVISNGAQSAEEGSHFAEGQRHGLQVDREAFVKGVQPEPPFAPLKSTFGAVNVVPDSDGIIRRVPLFFAHGGRLYPGLAMQTVISVLGVRPDQISVVPGEHVTIVDTPRGTLRIPIDAHGQTRVNFIGDLGVFTPAFKYLELYAAVEDETFAAKVVPELKNRTVLVGNVSTGNADVVTTSVGRMPGVVVQATLVNSMLTGSHLRFLPVRWQVAFILAAGALLGVLMMVRHPVGRIAIFLGFILCWFGVSVQAASSDWMLPVVPVLMTCGLTALGLLALEAALWRQDRSRVVGSLGRYVARPLLRRLVDMNEAPQAASERRELSVFFSDIRGFTAWTERAEPDEVTQRLNDYFSAMTPLVEKHGGTLDKFIGDCVMVFFGAPEAMEDHAVRAVRMAWDMQREMDRLNEAWIKRGLGPLRIGIGIHTGYVTVGNFGSSAFLDYTVIGRGVNLAARIESHAPGGCILLSARTQSLVQPVVETRPFGELVLKGIPETTPVFEVLCIQGMEAARQSPEPAAWWLVEGAERRGPFPLEGIEVMKQCGRIRQGTSVVGPEGRAGG